MKKPAKHSPGLGKKLDDIEMLYTTLFNSIDEAFIVLELIFDKHQNPVDYRHVLVNPAYEKHTGLTNVEGKRILELLPDLEKFWINMYGEIALTGQPVRFQNYVKQLNRWFDLYAFRIGPSENRLVAVLFRDITKIKETQETQQRLLEQIRDNRKQIKARTQDLEKALADKEEAFNELSKSEHEKALILDNTTEIIALHDLEQRIVWANKAYQKAMGLTLEYIKGQKCYSCWGLSGLCMNCPVSKAIKTGKPVKADMTPENQPLWSPDQGSWEVIAAPVFEEGEITGAIEIAIDITERKKAEQALSLSEHHFRAIANYTFAWEIWISIEGKHLWTNPAVERITGYTVDECTSMDNYPASMVFEPDRKIFHTLIERAMNQSLAGSVDNEFRIRKKDDSVIWVSMSWNTIYDDQRKWQKIRASIIDIDASKTAQELLDEKKNELESIIYATTHDFRAPLVNIDGFAHVLDESLEKIAKEIDGSKLSKESKQLIEKEIPQALELIYSNTKKLDNILAGLLQVSRIAEPNPVPLGNVESIIREIINSLSVLINKISAEVEIKPLPGCVGDKIQIKAIFEELISNALKYRREDVQLKITISGEVSKFQAIYCVQDNGIGISESQQSQLFRLFHKLDPEKEGKGIGLAKAKRLAHRNQGNIWVDSEENKGSRFFVALPENLPVLDQLSSHQVPTANHISKETN